jgi:hypothetical protein
VALDVTVTSPTQVAQVSREAANAEAALNAATVETFGGWDASAVDSLKAIARNVGHRSNVDHSTTMRHLFQRLGVTLQRSWD